MVMGDEKRRALGVARQWFRGLSRRQKRLLRMERARDEVIVLEACPGHDLRFLRRGDR